MSYLDNNLECIKQCRPQIYEKLIAILENKKYDCSKFKLISTKDGVGTIEMEYNEKKIRLNSLYSPVKEAEKWVGQFNLKNISVSVLMFGIANGIFANSVLKHTANDAEIFLFEPDISLFIYGITNFPMETIINDKRVHIFVDDINEKDLYFRLQEYISSEMLPTQIICFYPKLNDIYSDKYNNFVYTVEKAKSYLRAITYTRNNLAQIAVENMIYNISLIKDSNYITELENIAPQNVPVIIVSAGPSLDKNIDELKNAVGKSIIIATDTAVKTLLSHNIEFDAIVTIDANKSEKHLSDPACFDYPVFTTIYAKHTILDKNINRKIWIAGNSFLVELYKKYNLEFYPYEVGGSVSTAAFNIARALATNVIILVGQDLAFSGEFSHAGEVSDHSYDEENGIVYIEDIYGNQIRSRGDWVMFRDWFESIIDGLDRSIKVIDASEGGAKINGTEIMNLSTAINEYCNTEFDFKSRLGMLNGTFCGKRYESLRNDLYHLKKEMSNIRIYADKGIKAIDGFMLEMVIEDEKNVNEKECYKIVKQVISFVEKQLVYKIIDYYIEQDISESMNVVNCITGDPIEEKLKTYKILRHMFEVINKAVDELSPLLDEVLEKV